MNVDYKIFAKILSNRLYQALDKVIVKEQTCAVKGRFMWDNLGILRELVQNKNKENFYIVTLDQKKAFDLVSREYLWYVLEMYGFPVAFVDMIECLYHESNVQININEANQSDGVKQGCPLSTALYVLATNPLIRYKMIIEYMALTQMAIKRCLY